MEAELKAALSKPVGVGAKSESKDDDKAPEPGSDFDSGKELSSMLGISEAQLPKLRFLLQDFMKGKK